MNNKGSGDTVAYWIMTTGLVIVIILIFIQGSISIGELLGELGAAVWIAIFCFGYIRHCCLSELETQQAFGNAKH